MGFNDTRKRSREVIRKLYEVYKKAKPVESRDKAIEEIVLYFQDSGYDSMKDHQ